MLRFWRNPLLILYVRAELRPARAVMVAAISLIICILIAMGCWSENSKNAQGFWTHFYGWLLGAQFVVLGVWSAGTCGQAVARERELKTFDFLKTTRLTSSELMVGKLLGAPIVAYFVIACTLPISVLAGLVAGIRPMAVLGSIVLLLSFTLFYSLAALLGSMLVEKSSSGAVGLLGLLANLFFLVFSDGPFKGFAAISVVPALFSLHRFDADLAYISPTVFGVTVPCIILTLFLYILLGAWLVAMIVRNLKRDLPQIQLLSRWQCVGLMAFWNLLFYAFLDTKVFLRNPSPLHSALYAYRAHEIAMFAVAWNSVFLFLIGLASLSPHEKLKGWWRKWKSGEGSYFAADGLPWPWLVPAAIIGYGMLTAEAFGLRSTVPLAEWRLGFGALASGGFLVFTARDVLFLQWCLLTRMKHPVMKGILFLVLYNTAVGLLGAVITMISSVSTTRVLTLLTPYVLLGGGAKPPSPPAFILSAIVVHAGICAVFLHFIQRRLSRPVQLPVGGAV